MLNNDHYMLKFRERFLYKEMPSEGKAQRAFCNYMNIIFLLFNYSILSDLLGYHVKQILIYRYIPLYCQNEFP